MKREEAMQIGLSLRLKARLKLFNRRLAINKPIKGNLEFKTATREAKTWVKGKEWA